jgi:hypothetical protein
MNGKALNVWEVGKWREGKCSAALVQISKRKFDTAVIQFESRSEILTSVQGQSQISRARHFIII